MSLDSIVLVVWLIAGLVLGLVNCLGINESLIYGAKNERT